MKNKTKIIEEVAVVFNCDNLFLKSEGKIKILKAEEIIFDMFNKKIITKDKEYPFPQKLFIQMNAPDCRIQGNLFHRRPKPKLEELF